VNNTNKTKLLPEKVTKSIYDNDEMESEKALEKRIRTVQTNFRIIMKAWHFINEETGEKKPLDNLYDWIGRSNATYWRVIKKKHEKKYYDNLPSVIRNSKIQPDFLAVSKVDEVIFNGYKDININYKPALFLDDENNKFLDAEALKSVIKSLNAEELKAYIESLDAEALKAYIESLDANVLNDHIKSLKVEVLKDLTKSLNAEVLKSYIQSLKPEEISAYIKLLNIEALNLSIKTKGVKALKADINKLYSQKIKTFIESLDLEDIKACFQLLDAKVLKSLIHFLDAKALKSYIESLNAEEYIAYVKSIDEKELKRQIWLLDVEFLIACVKPLDSKELKSTELKTRFDELLDEEISKALKAVKERLKTQKKINKPQDKNSQDENSQDEKYGNIINIFKAIKNYKPKKNSKDSSEDKGFIFSDHFKKIEDSLADMNNDRLKELYNCYCVGDKLSEDDLRVYRDNLARYLKKIDAIIEIGKLR
jgi:hypothetical protein